MNGAIRTAGSTGAPSSAALACHERTRHCPKRHAAGPGALDGDAQPGAFRHFGGAAVTARPLPAKTDDTRRADPFLPSAVAPRAPTPDAPRIVGAPPRRHPQAIRP